MRNEFILELLDSRLNVFLRLIEQCPPDKRRVIPNGFKNHLHWHVGHVLTVTEFHVFTLSNQPAFLPERYQALFAYGTKPADWQEEPPAWNDLVSQLSAQAVLIRETFKDRLDEPVPENFLKAQTIGELIVSTELHLLDHAGFVNAMLKALQAE
ncbi:DinB superfamily protein [Paenibacillus sp. UNC496MF]|uniref:DinB family protein n=1 Tax=Paenibacillus sp. UNC496MF TaxID=1502753 RepID=UPI0008EB102D|nr:DinB family protein [Paenibacillus sp. UNC496MF]SFJ14341.1 DinB superfamily protein [Paenibacillus sp. UNC496MF]